MTAKQRAEREARWARRYYGQLRGWKVTSVAVKVEDDMGYPEVWPTLTMTNPKYPGVKLKVEVSQDPEGNGPGFLFGLPMVDPEPVS